VTDLIVEPSKSPRREPRPRAPAVASVLFFSFADGLGVGW